MTSTNITVGFHDQEKTGSKNKADANMNDADIRAVSDVARFNQDNFAVKILKPPGGGCSDIFGTGGNAGLDGGQAQRANTQVKSSTFDQTPISTAAENKARNGNSYSMRMVFGGDSEPTTETPRKVKDYQKSNVFTPGGDEVNGNYAKRSTAGGNPITGEGYTEGPKEDTTGQNASVRVRNPPGGRSTNLW